MSSAQLEDQWDAEFREYVAEQLGITVDELDQVLTDTAAADEHGLELVVNFDRDAPVEILKKIKGLSKDARSIRIDAPHYFDQSDPSDWDDTGYVANPKSEFNSNYWDLTYLLGELGRIALPVRATDLQIRMIFKEAFTALEAYLGDTIQNAVVADRGALGKFVGTVKTWKFEMIDLVKNENLLQDKVKQHLQEILYHKFEKVDPLYRDTLGVKIWPSDDVKRFLYKARQIRHDYTHRNGRSADGTAQAELTVAYVKETLQAVQAVVEHIESQLPSPWSQLL